MTGRLRYIFLAGLMLCFTCPVVLFTDNGAMATVISKPSKRVLLLYSYQAVQPINLIWDAAIRTALKGPAEDPLEFYTEYMDLSQFPDESHRQRLLNFLKEKYAGRQMDLVIPLGEFAFRFLLSHRDFLFPGVPLVFCGPLKRDLQTFPRPKAATGVFTPIDMPGTLAAALKLHPRTRQLVLVGGASEIDRIFYQMGREAVQPYEGRLEVKFLIDLPIEEILTEVTHLPPETLILFLNFQRDSQGIVYIPSQALSRISLAANAPIYGLWETLLGNGIVGGHLVNFESQAIRAGELGRRVLAGENPEDMSLVSEGVNDFMFDWRQLQRWGLRERDLPPGSAVRFRVPSLWDEYRREVIVASTVIGLLSVLVVILLISLGRRRRAEASLDRRLEFESLLAELSAQLVCVSAGAVDQEITQGIKKLVEFVGADRGLLWRFSENPQDFRPTHLWAAVGLEPTPLTPVGEHFPWIRRQWLEGRAVVLSKPDELPAEAQVDQQSLIASRTQSLLSIPLSVGGAFIGALTLSTINSQKVWPPELPQELRPIGEIFGNAVVRQQSELEIARLKEQLQADYSYLQEEIKLTHNFEHIIGNSNELKYVLHKVEQVAPTDTTVLILGETGTGKELIARAIHSASPRRSRPLIKVDCAALSPSLIESELFGHEKGAFTGAQSRKMGRFELAHGSTIFLDEIGELPLGLQTKLLRVVQEGEFERLGSSQTLKVDVRLIAATNRDLAKEVKQGHFREDLWYRLHVFPITVPPLRQRQGDIPLLAKYFVERLARKMGKEITTIPPDVLAGMQQYSWPGNVRELENTMERAVIHTQGPVLKMVEQLTVSRAATLEPMNQSLEAVERAHILKVLEAVRWKIDGKNGAAARLELNPSTLRSRMRKLGIERQ